ncbi:hypothetical protein [Lysinibacillus capsici]|uniref:hypothetical protein n=1 Tax=Lysinibacillus capsici TaxID=2115968 RepID=UPI002A7EE7E0|nr:hypothetical protein [Lysinibacillus capsici]
MEPVEVIEFMEHVAPNTGDRISHNTIQRKFRGSYADAEKAINKLVELGYLESKCVGGASFYLRK